ncbi:proprotein convertase subtilisin/kexin type 4-like isoform X2 [Acanthochromis polyacanthus]|uniref:proprotein convertase subtilisin/kexin type 4-like isoform X2 n=1 Tax=Acanthochromis polyacanthus TaxID=80966 RepID=UPI0022347D74|nr:proprotein convertase subtilisin/kexin type 4-like isoform X2 [Acanthochromis polyacanthus]
MFRAFVLVFGCLLQRKLVTTEGHHGTNCHVFYAVQMDGGTRAARALAKQHGLEFIQRVGSLEGLYTLRDSRGRPDRGTFEDRLATAGGVHWVQRQHSHYRSKRVPLTTLDHSPATSSQRTESASDRQPEENKSDQSLTFNDPLWPMQWELFAQGEYNSSGFDLNVMPVWRNNITGDGVVVSIIDDGVDHTNKDLKKNFEVLASFDLRASHGLSHDPMPARNYENSHGTHCAGEVAMEANNSYCGVGIAFNARIGGIRLLDGSVTDAMEATALTFNSHFIDIYVCSWGPRDDGAEMDGPHSLTERALRLGTHKGRSGKGSVFVWAAGNGGMQHDHCGADGYVNSIYNVAIGAVTQTGKPTYFSEPCPGVMAVTLTGSSVGGPLPLVTLTNMGDGCITHFPGTSSAAPIAAGILALALEVNPELTWRDVQHLIANTAKIPDAEEPGWSINAAGYHVHHRYGFGLLDAGLMVQQAARFHTAAAQRKCTQAVTLPTRIISPGAGVSVNIQSEACHGKANEINTLEHVQVRVGISAVCRGDLSISLKSPGGTVSLLLDTRPNDASTTGLKNWTLMTVHCWGEQPQGIWTLQVTDHKGTVRSCTRPSEEEAAGALLSVTLILYGTYHPHRSTHEGPLQSIVYMGSQHPVPHRVLYQRDRYPPLDLIQWIYQMERDRKVRAADITVPARHKVRKTSGNMMAQLSLNKPLTSRVAYKLHQAGVAQKSSLRSRPAAEMELHETKTGGNDVDGRSRSLPSQVVQDVAMAQVQQSASSDAKDEGTVLRQAGEGTEDTNMNHG